jgi:hypothetical protein
MDLGEHRRQEQDARATMAVEIRRNLADRRCAELASRVDSALADDRAKQSTSNSPLYP